MPDETEDDERGADVPTREHAVVDAINIRREANLDVPVVIDSDTFSIIRTRQGLLCGHGAEPQPMEPTHKYSTISVRSSLATFDYCAERTRRPSLT